MGMTTMCAQDTADDASYGKPCVRIMALYNSTPIFDAYRALVS